MEEPNQTNDAPFRGFSEELPPDPTSSEPTKHSGLGIASFVIGLVALLIGIGLIIGIAAFAPEWQESLGNNAELTDEEIQRFSEENGGTIALVGMGIIFDGLLILLGMILGIVSLFNKERKKLFPILGTVLNGLPILFLIFSIVFASATA